MYHPPAGGLAVRVGERRVPGLPLRGSPNPAARGGRSGYNPGVASRDIDRVGLVLAGLGLAWAVLIVAAPGLASLPAAGGPAVSAVAYGVGAFVCHQRAERSFHVAGAQLPVCGRCTGLYLSAAAGILFAWTRRGFAVRSFTRWRIVLLWSALPTVVTLLAEWWWPAAVSSAVRAAAAAPFGAAAGALLAGTIGFRSKLPGCERTRHDV